MNKPDSIIRIPVSVDGGFFRYYLEFLRPFHKLTDRETDVLAAFLRHRHELSKVIQDEEILDRVTMGEDTKREIREELGMALAHFQVIMGKLRKVKVIVDGRINPKFIPSIAEGSGYFQLLLLFDLRQ